MGDLHSVSYSTMYYITKNIIKNMLFIDTQGTKLAGGDGGVHAKKAFSRDMFQVLIPGF